MPRSVARWTVAITAVTISYATAREPSVSPSVRRTIAAPFKLTRIVLPGIEGVAVRTEREVNPSLKHISAWISSVGAAAALADLDGDGFSNDLCHVDPRFDAVIVAPVPDVSSSARFPAFALESRTSRSDATVAPMGCLPGDVNEDGMPDVVVYYWGRPPVAYLRRSFVGPVELKAFSAQPLADASERWYTNALTFADVDGDGHPDLVAGNYFRDSADVLDARSQRATAMQHSMSRARNAGRNRLLLWHSAQAAPTPGVRYVDASYAFSDDAAFGWTLAIAAADLDGDLLPELYIANDFGPDRLLLNRSARGRPRFALLEGHRTSRMPASKVLGRDSFKGMGVEIGDFNGDNVPDIGVSNITEAFGLQESNFLFLGTGAPLAASGTAPFVERSESLGVARSGWAWDMKFADLDNEGTPELLQAVGFVRGRVNRWPELQELATANDQLLSHSATWPRFGPGTDLSGGSRNALFAKPGDRAHVDVAREAGFVEPAPSRGIAIGDTDGDGDLDLIVANQWAPSTFYRNDCEPCGKFVGLQLQLPTSTAVAARTLVMRGSVASASPSRPAIGAIATLLTDDGRRRSIQVDGGNGHSGKRSPQVLFGLGRTPPGPARVEVRWRDRHGVPLTDTLRLPSRGWYTVVLRDAEVQPR